ncbi:RHS repeat-associated core domain-containing protein [Pseudomonas sp. T1.Ur]|uniref:RHS repeat-associated core domain-containing protein n=1 Tax=Pseudomonas sp. T1.Ur TaxID=2928704 RepID=UPI00201D6472|nr:RHS repeat-associated core domain-containing protein [Pseudomonas sp. T1.Ur]MCL6705204.1 RHS repeat-associated core domain-containing protein [Pseudomonas sp. T1.Ur]
MPAASRETVLCRYRYDPLDRLVDCAPCAEIDIQRFYCKSRLATEIQGAVQRSVFQHDDQLLAQRRREDAKVETALLATDQQRSVLNVLDANRIHPLAYSPYGHRPAENGLLSLLGFNGERPDPVTGHYLLGNGYRAFNPVLMRFNSPDNLSPFGKGGLNAYGYSVGDPINWTDPTGHIKIPVNMSLITPGIDDFLKSLIAPTGAISKSAKSHRRIMTLRTSQRKYYASLKNRTHTITANEKLLKNQNSYTINDNMTDLEQSSKAYELAKQGYGFEKYPDPSVKHEIQINGSTLLDTAHFDATIAHFKKANNTHKIKTFNLKNPSTPLKRTDYQDVYLANIKRAEYIKNFTGIDLLKEIRQ